MTAATAPARAAIAAAIAIAIAPLPARADSSWSGTVPEKARTLADRGRAAHDAGDYTAAIAAFTQAYVMAPSPALLFNLAQAYRLQGNCDDAALMYRRYLATNPGPEARALAEGHLANVERCLHKLALHIPVETASGRPAVRPPEPLAMTFAAPPVSRKAQIEKDVGIGLVIGGSVALVGALYYTVQAHDASNDVAAAYAMGGAKWKNIAPLDERGKASAARAKLLGAGGALGVAGGIVTYLIGRHTEQPPITVLPTSRGAQLNVLWAF
jgi:tetratricopeptide (TPR) repeat protein